MTDETNAAIDALTKEVKRLNDHRFIRVQNSVPRLLLFQLGRGLAFGLGTVMGASVLVSIIAWWASQFSFLPIVGDWLVQIVEQMEQAR